MKKKKKKKKNSIHSEIKKFNTQINTINMAPSPQGLSKFIRVFS